MSNCLCQLSTCIIPLQRQVLFYSAGSAAFEQLLSHKKPLPQQIHPSQLIIDALPVAPRPSRTNQQAYVAQDLRLNTACAEPWRRSGCAAHLGV